MMKIYKPILAALLVLSSGAAMAQTEENKPAGGGLGDLTLTIPAPAEGLTGNTYVGLNLGFSSIGSPATVGDLWNGGSLLGASMTTFFKPKKDYAGSLAMFFRANLDYARYATSETQIDDYISKGGTAVNKKSDFTNLEIITFAPSLGLAFNTTGKISPYIEVGGLLAAPRQSSGFNSVVDYGNNTVTTNTEYQRTSSLGVKAGAGLLANFSSYQLNFGFEYLMDMVGEGNVIETTITRPSGSNGVGAVPTTVVKTTEANGISAINIKLGIAKKF